MKSGRDVYDEVVAALPGAGYEIATSYFDAENFGYWGVTIAREPQLEVFWEARDQELQIYSGERMLWRTAAEPDRLVAAALDALHEVAL